MKIRIEIYLIAFVALLSPAGQAQALRSGAGATLVLESNNLAGTRNLKLDSLFYETADGRTILPAQLTKEAKAIKDKQWSGEIRMPGGRVVSVSVTPQGNNFVIRLKAQPDADIVKWGLAIDARDDEYYTGLMERVVDGPQAASWAPGITKALNLRGQKVEMIVKPTTSIYAPFYLSSRGYAIFVKGTWPGVFDFAAADQSRVKTEFEPRVIRRRWCASMRWMPARRSCRRNGCSRPGAGATNTRNVRSITTARRLRDRLIRKSWKTCS